VVAYNREVRVWGEVGYIHAVSVAELGRDQGLLLLFVDNTVEDGTELLVILMDDSSVMLPYGMLDWNCKGAATGT
jgi:hypothetical protein